jgi:hypothetical protein
VVGGRGQSGVALHDLVSVFRSGSGGIERRSSLLRDLGISPLHRVFAAKISERMDGRGADAA